MNFKLIHEQRRRVNGLKAVVAEIGHVVCVKHNRIAQQFNCGAVFVDIQQLHFVNQHWRVKRKHNVATATIVVWRRTVAVRRDDQNFSQRLAIFAWLVGLAAIADAWTAARTVLIGRAQIKIEWVWIGAVENHQRMRARIVGRQRDAVKQRKVCLASRKLLKVEAYTFRAQIGGHRVNIDAVDAQLPNKQFVLHFGAVLDQQIVFDHHISLDLQVAQRFDAPATVVLRVRVASRRSATRARLFGIRRIVQIGLKRQ